MSSINSPLGLKPAWHPSGTIRQAKSQFLENVAVSIFQYGPVGIGPLGGIASVTATAVLTTGGIVGAFMGIEYTDINGKRTMANKWIAGTVTAANPEFQVYYTFDPDTVYEIQSSGVLAQTNIGETFNWSAPAGSLATGLSNVVLDNAGDAAGGLRIIGINNGPNNAIADAFPVVQVMIRKYNWTQLPATTV